MKIQTIKQQLIKKNEKVNTNLYIIWDSNQYNFICSLDKLELPALPIKLTNRTRFKPVKIK